MLQNRFAIVSLVFLHILYQVWNSVSQIHSTAINGDAINEVGTFHNLWYHFFSLQALWIASFIFDAVLPSPSMRSKTQYRAVLAVSETAQNGLQAKRGATHKVFHTRSRNPHMIYQSI